MPPRLGGVIVIAAGQLRFVSAKVAHRVLMRPPISPVPGTSLGITLVEGLVVPVVELGASHDVLLCQARGELVALAGVQTVECGFFESQGAGVAFGGQEIPVMDVEAELEQLKRQVATHNTSEVV